MSKILINKGQSLFEVVVALAVSALVIVALVSLVSSSIRNATFSKNKASATNYTQEATEWLRGQRDENVSDFIDKTLTSSWCLNNLDWNAPGACPSQAVISGTIFKRQAGFTTNVLGGKEIVEATIIVSWEDAQGTHAVESITNFSDWRER